jgi:hypothetical protein
MTNDSSSNNLNQTKYGYGGGVVDVENASNNSVSLLVLEEYLYITYNTTCTSYSEYSTSKCTGSMRKTKKEL